MSLITVSKLSDKKQCEMTTNAENLNIKGGDVKWELTFKISGNIPTKNQAFDVTNTFAY